MIFSASVSNHQQISNSLVSILSFSVYLNFSSSCIEMKTRKGAFTHQNWLAHNRNREHYSAYENSCIMFTGAFCRSLRTLMMSPGLPWFGHRDDTF